MNEREVLAGQRIEVIAPSGAHLSLSEFDQARAWFEARGAQVLSDVPRVGWQRFSAPDDDRLEAIHRAARRPDTSAVMITRGGYGLSRLLDRIDWALVAESAARGCRWIGYSDFTAFQLGLLARTGAGSFSGPAFSGDFAGEGPNQFSFEQFATLLSGRLPVVRWRAGQGVAAAGDLAGPLWGGNLSMLVAGVGTPWIPDIEGGLLFVEDVSEHPYRVERMLHQLYFAGILSRQRALILGDFTGWKLASHDRGYGMEAMVDYWRSRLSIPVVTGLPFGHSPVKAVLGVGQRYRLRVDSGFALLEPLDSLPAARTPPR